MKVVLQRADGARVHVDGDTVASFEGPGLVLLVGAGVDDQPDDPDRLAEKIAGLRVFADDQGKTNLAVGDVGGTAIVVSQFTLYGSVRKGRRPSFTAAADPGPAEERVEAFASALERAGVPVQRGVFGGDMRVEFTNDGPFTLLLDASELRAPR